MIIYKLFEFLLPIIFCSIGDKTCNLLYNPGSLKTIQEYLRKIEINNDELSFIKDTSIQVIRNNNAQPSRSSTRAGSLSNTAPKPGLSKLVMLKLTSSKRSSVIVTKEYFFNKRHANAIINLQEYLIAEEVEEDYLEDSNLLQDMLRRAMKKFPTLIEIYELCHEIRCGWLKNYRIS
ncbi:hypothetical protein TKK_0003690 [Trichogramma kaykai]